MADLDPTLVRLEAERLVRRAMDHIQRAQAELGRASAELSSLEGGIRVWNATGKLYDRVHDLWYRVQAFRQGGRFTLDGVSREAFAKRLPENGGGRADP